MEEIYWAQSRSASLALIAIRVRVAAFWAGSGYISICKKLSGLFVKILFTFYFLEFTFLVKGSEKILAGLMVNWRRSTVIHIEGNPNAMERGFEQLMICLLYTSPSPRDS